MFEKCEHLVPSRRGELEITDVNNAYIREGSMSFSHLDGWWTDAGTFESLLLANCHAVIAANDAIADHLKAGLIDWLTGSLPGIYIPKAFSLGEIVKFVFSVLGLTWQNIRGKLGVHSRAEIASWMTRRRSLVACPTSPRTP